MMGDLLVAGLLSCGAGFVEIAGRSRHKCNHPPFPRLPPVNPFPKAPCFPAVLGFFAVGGFHGTKAVHARAPSAMAGHLF